LSSTIRALDKNSNNFIKESNIENILSRIVYNSRLYSIGYINYYIKVNNIEEDNNKFLETYLDNNLTILSNNYFSELYTIRNKLKYYNFNTISTYKPIKNINSDNFKLENTIINIPKLKELFNSNLENLEITLYRNLLLFDTNSKEDKIVNIDLKKIIDNKDNNNYLEDLSNTTYLSTFRDTYIKRFYNKESIIYKYFNRNNKLVPNIKLFLKRVYKFLEILLLNFYILSSSPLRGEEITILTYKNSTINGLRNIYFDNETRLIAINTSYSKSRDLNNISKSNIRFLPFRLTRVTIYYITLLKPFIDYLNFNYLNNKDINTKLFINSNNNTLSSNLLSNLLSKETKKHFNIKLGIKLYRHLITYIIKDRILKNNLNLLTPTKKTKYFSKSNKIEDILANRSTTIANLNYARESNLFLNKTRDITTRSIEFTNLYYNYFSISNYISIEDILLESYRKDELEEEKEENNTSNSNSNSSSISIDLEATSINPTLRSKNIIEDLEAITITITSNNSSSSSSSSNSSKLETSTPSKLNKSNLKELDKLESSNKNRTLTSYLDNLDSNFSSSSSSNSSTSFRSLDKSKKSNKNRKSTIIDLDLDNIEFTSRISSSISNSSIIDTLEDSNLDSINLVSTRERANLESNNNLEISSSNRSLDISNSTLNKVDLVSKSNIIRESNSNPKNNLLLNRRGRPRLIRTNKRGRPKKEKK